MTAHMTTRFQARKPPREPRSFALPPTNSRLIAIMRRFPVTSLLLMPYLLLILPQAVAFSNPHTDLILRVLGIALVPALVVEALLQPRRHLAEEEAPPAAYPRLLGVAKTVTAIGIVVGLVRAALGARSVFASTGRIESLPPIVTLIAPFSQWTVAGIGLLVAAHLQRMLTRGQLFRWLAAAATAQAVGTLLSARTAPLAAFAIFLMTLLLYCGILSPRKAGVIALAVLVAWPTLFALRNEARVEGGVAVSSSVGALDRLRYDLQITRAEPLGYPIDLDTPGPLEALRYGLIPRFLDSDRAQLSTGTKINVYLGGSSTSAFSFLPVTNAYVLDGPLATATFYALWAAALSVLLRHGRRATPMRLVFFGLAVAGPLGWFTTYPDSSIGLVESLASVVPIAIILRFGNGASRTPVPRDRHAGSRHALTRLARVSANKDTPYV